MRKLLNAVLSVLYPQRCLGCQVFVQADEHFCQGCARCVTPITSPLCLRCGIPFSPRSGPDHDCGSCRENPPLFRRARTWAHYQYGEGPLQPVSEAIQQFKYHRNLGVGKRLAQLAATHFPLVEERYDVIIPVPLHLNRLRWRGFNQSLLLSRAIGHIHQIRVDPFLLERSRPTVPQTQLKEKERRENVKGAFTVLRSNQIQERRVLLVDDVYTSGATVTECTKVLLHAGALAVDVFTLARAV
ncbi:MAG: ComF family protein [Deltaproteobacteria bacterium]|nr:ComF family protein [Deltaproteobacteria bacterium]